MKHIVWNSTLQPSNGSLQIPHVKEIVKNLCEHLAGSLMLAYSQFGLIHVHIDLIHAKDNVKRYKGLTPSEYHWSLQY